jgi:hypothetical protein
MWFELMKNNKISDEGLHSWLTKSYIDVHDKNIDRMIILRKSQK